MDWTSPAPAKLNLFLKVTGRRTDGYHDLVSLAAFTEFGDQLTVSDDRPAGLTLSGPFASTLQDTADDNLILKAQAAVRSAGFLLPDHHIHLDKHIPVSSGLGGGSADVAAYLRCLARMMQLDPTEQKGLFELAGQIGADVPVCLRPGYQIMRGTGTDVQPVAVDKTPVYCVLSNPGVAVSTQRVFSTLRGLRASAELTIPASGPVQLDKMLAFGNDLYAAAVQLCPQIGTLLEDMDRLCEPEQVFGRAMSGSGASCFALTGSRAAADKLRQQLEDAGYWAVSTQLTAGLSSSEG